MIIVKLLSSKNFSSNTTPKAKNEVNRALFLNCVISKSSAIFQLLASKDETLLIRRNALLILDLLLHIFDRVRAFNLKGDGLSGKGLHKDLHVVCKCAQM